MPALATEAIWEFLSNKPLTAGWNVVRVLFWRNRRARGLAPWEASADWLRQVRDTCVAPWSAADWLKIVWLHAECWTKDDWTEWSQHIRVKGQDLVPQAPFAPDPLLPSFLDWWWDGPARRTADLLAALPEAARNDPRLYAAWSATVLEKYRSCSADPTPEGFRNWQRMATVNAEWIHKAVQHADEADLWAVWADPASGMHAQSTLRSALEKTPRWDARLESTGAALGLGDTDPAWLELWGNWPLAKPPAAETVPAVLLDVAVL